MQKEIPRPIVVVILILIVLVAAFAGWRYLQQTSRVVSQPPHYEPKLPPGAEKLEGPPLPAGEARFRTGK